MQAAPYRRRITGVVHGETKCESTPQKNPMSKTAEGSEKLRTPENHVQHKKMIRAATDPIAK
jgi:hypothetical protein